MWAVEGLTHRYPTKVLAEMISTCPQYCGHCTRMDLVGNDTAQILKYKFEAKQQERWDAMLDYLRRTPSVRDVVVSGGDVANIPVKRLEEFVLALLDIPNIRDIRLATKGLMGLPQHFLQDDVLKGYEVMATRARERDVDIAIHTHINAAQQVTPLVARAVRKLLDMGYRDVRNQGVLLRGVNTTPASAPGALLHAPRPRQGHALLLLHVRHDPQLRALADLAGGGPGPSVRAARLPAGLRHPARRVRRAVRGQAVGPHGEELRPGPEASPTGRRTTARGSSSTTPTRSSASTRTTTPSTPCPKRARSTGASTSARAGASSSRSDPAQASVTWLNRSKYCWNSSSDRALYSYRFASDGSSGGNSSGLWDRVS